MSTNFPVPHQVTYQEWWLPHNEALLDKAIEQPSEITPEEKHKILHWAPPGQVEENIEKYLPGRTFESLIHLAATDPHSLSYPEFVLITDGFHILKKLDRMGRNAMRTTLVLEHVELNAKRERARQLISTPDEVQALDKVNNRAFYVAKRDAHINEKKRKVGLTPPWVCKILEREDKAWGYRIYCDSDRKVEDVDVTKSWDKFRSRLQESVAGLPCGPEVLGFNRGATMGAEQIRATKVMDFIDFKGDMDDIESLREDFRNRRDQGLLKPGVLENAFIFVTTESRDSFLSRGYPWVWVVDPDWSLNGPDEDGYCGFVPVLLAPLFAKFYNFISTGRFTMKQIWQEYVERSQACDDPGWQQTQLDALVWPDI